MKNENEEKIETKLEKPRKRFGKYWKKIKKWKKRDWEKYCNELSGLNKINEVKWRTNLEYSGYNIEEFYVAWKKIFTNEK